MREHLGPVTCQVRPVWNGWLACGRELVVSEEQALLSGCGAACGPRLGLVNRELDLGVCPPPAPELSTGSLPLDTCSCAGTPAPVGRGTHPRGFVFSLLSADTEDVCIVERLFSSSLVAIVSLKAPRKLKVCHFKKGTEICNYSYSNTILAVKLNRQVGGTPAHRPGALGFWGALGCEAVPAISEWPPGLGQIPAALLPSQPTRARLCSLISEVLLRLPLCEDAMASAISFNHPSRCEPSFMSYLFKKPLSIFFFF